MNDAHPSRYVRVVLVTTGLAVAVGLGGCTATGSLSPSAEKAAAVAEAFSAAVAAGRGAEACDLLVPAAQDEAAGQSGTDCATGVLSLGLPEAGSVLSEKAYGRASFVELEHDTVFLAVSGSSWRVRAAGCVEQSDAPYDCALEGD